MATITLTGTYVAGYALAAPITTLSIAASGYVGGQGVTSPGAATNAYQVLNDGRIEAAAYLEGNGVVLTHGGAVINGRTSGAAAVISGFDGVDISGRPGKVINFGTIEGVYGHGVVLSAGGSVTNGSNADTTARIEAYDLGVVLKGKSNALANFGTISIRGDYGQGEAAVYLNAPSGGSITNGSKSDTTALISGYHAIRSRYFNPVTLTNFGTIAGSPGRQASGVYLAGGGLITNGSGADLRAQIIGGVAAAAGALTLANFGRIVGYGAQTGVLAGNGCAITNGSSLATHAFIQGATGISCGGFGSETITNFGTIWGRNGTSVAFSQGGSSRLIVEAGSAFVGTAVGGNGALELAGGVGLMTLYKGALSTAGALTISGSMAKSTFSGFSLLQFDTGAAFTVAAVTTVAVGLTIQAAGSLSLEAGGASIAVAALIEANGAAGAITFDGVVVSTGTLIANGGSIDVTGALSGSGSATIVGRGSLDFGGAASQAVTFSGPGGVLALGDSQEFTGAITGFSGAGKTSLDIGDIAFTGPAEATFSGTATSGVLTITDGTHTAHITLIGDYLKTTFVTSDDTHGGVIVAGEPKGGAASLRLAQAAAGLTAPAASTAHMAATEAFHETRLALPRAMLA